MSLEWKIGACRLTQIWSVEGWYSVAGAVSKDNSSGHYFVYVHGSGKPLRACFRRRVDAQVHLERLYEIKQLLRELSERRT